MGVKWSKMGIDNRCQWDYNFGRNYIKGFAILLSKYVDYSH